MTMTGIKISFNHESHHHHHHHLASQKVFIQIRNGIYILNKLTNTTMRMDEIVCQLIAESSTGGKCCCGCCRRIEFVPDVVVVFGKFD